MADNATDGFNIHDAFAEYYNLSDRDQQKIRQTQAGCDHAGVDDYGQKTTCNQAGTHAVFAFKHDDDLDVTNPDEVAKGGFEKFGVVNEGKARNIIPQEDIRIYCPEHAETAKQLLNSKVANTKISADGSTQTTVEAGKMPLHHLQESDDPDHKRFLRQYSGLVKQLRSALTLNTIRHSGLVKNVPPRGYASGTTETEEDDAEKATREEFGQTSIEAATGSNLSDLSEAMIHEALHPNFEQDKAPTAMDAARQQLLVDPVEKTEAAAERKRVLNRLGKARKKNEYWCSNCNKSTQQNYSCMDCGKDAVHSKDVEVPKPGRPLKVGEDSKVEVTSHSLIRANQAIKGNAVTVKNENGELVQLPSTVNNVSDFVAGKGYAPDFDFRVRGAHEKSDIARTHFAPTEDFEDPDSLAPNLGERGTQYFSRTGGVAMFSGPDRTDTGPALGTEINTSVSIDPETGSYVPVMGTIKGNVEQFDPSSTGFTSVNENKSVKSRKRRFALNVKVGSGVAPSTTCHECTLRGDPLASVKKSVKDHNGEVHNVCAKGHRLPTNNIPIAWDKEKDMAVHVYPRPTGLIDAQQRPLYDWIPTNEPAVYTSNRVLVPKEHFNKLSPFSHIQAFMSRRTRSLALQNFVKMNTKRIEGRGPTNNPEFEEKMAAEPQNRLNFFLELGKREASDPEAEAQRDYYEED